MKKVIIFGNSGSGKSTLAKQLCRAENLGHLDLDTIAWLPTNPPQRKQQNESKAEIDNFIAANEGWVIEGCYSELIDMAIGRSNEIIYLDLAVEECLANAKIRPWEPHKYGSKEAQDANLSMLIDWIREYEQRNDTFSKQVHERLFENYQGVKSRFTSNDRSK